MSYDPSKHSTAQRAIQHEHDEDELSNINIQDRMIHCTKFYLQHIKSSINKQLPLKQNELVVYGNPCNVVRLKRNCNTKPHCPHTADTLNQLSWPTGNLAKAAIITNGSV